jgi:hypothetical protein
VVGRRARTTGADPADDWDRDGSRSAPGGRRSGDRHSGVHFDRALRSCASTLLVDRALRPSYSIERVRAARLVSRQALVVGSAASHRTCAT